MPKYRGISKKRTHNPKTAVPSDRETARKNKIGCYMGTCAKGHNCPQRTLSNRCTTCEFLGVYENPR